MSIQQIAGEKRVGARGDANELLSFAKLGTCKIVPGDLHVSSLLSGVARRATGGCGAAPRPM